MAPSEPREQPRRAKLHQKHFHTVRLGGTHPYHALGPLKGPLRPPKGLVLAPKGPFGGLGGPRRATGSQIWSHLPPIGPPELESWSTHTLTGYWAPSGPQGALKWLVLALKRPFWGSPRSSEGPNGPDLVPTALEWSDGVKLRVTTHFDLILGPFWAPGGLKRARFCPEKPFWGAPRSSEGTNGPDLVPTAPEGPAEGKHRVTTLFGLISSP